MDLGRETNEKKVNNSAASEKFWTPQSHKVHIGVHKYLETSQPLNENSNLKLRVAVGLAELL